MDKRLASRTKQTISTVGIPLVSLKLNKPKVNCHLSSSTPFNMFELSLLGVNFLILHVHIYLYSDEVKLHFQ